MTPKQKQSSGFIEYTCAVDLDQEIDHINQDFLIRDLLDNLRYGFHHDDQQEILDNFRYAHIPNDQQEMIDIFDNGKGP